MGKMNRMHTANASRSTARHAGATRRASVKVFAKGKGKQMARGTGMQKPEMPVPPIDKDNEEFVLFARSKRSALKNWYPFTIMVGGSQANLLVKARENEISKAMTEGTLGKSLGATLYKEKDKLNEMVKERVPYLKVAKELEYGFKVRNKDKPQTWMFADGVEAIPAEEDCKGVLDKMNDFVSSFK